MNRILFVSPLANLTGAPKCVLILAEQIDKTNFSPIVVCLSEGALVDQLRERGIEVYVIPKNGLANAGVKGFKNLSFLGKIKFGLLQFRSMVFLAGIIIRERVSLVHVNTMMAPFEAIVAKMCRRRVVWSVLEIFSDSRELRLLTRLIERIADVVVVASKAVGQQFDGIREGETSKWTVAYTGIDPEILDSSYSGSGVRNEFGISANSPVVSLIGSLVPRKGTYFFVQAAVQILETHPATTFLLVGSPSRDRGYEKRIRDLVAELDLGESIIFTGQREDVFDVLDATDILVVPSLQDPFPWVVLEGMAMGKPIVASDVGGIPEAVLDGVTGILVPVADPDSLTSAIVSLLDDREKAISMGQKGKERVFTFFPQDRYIRSMEEIYSEVLGMS